MRTSYVSQVYVVDRHRNGISGVGFYLITFGYQTEPDFELKTLYGLVFDDGPVAVVNPLDPWDRYRGDSFEAELREIVRATESCDDQLPKINVVKNPTCELEGLIYVNGSLDYDCVNGHHHCAPFEFGPCANAVTARFELT